MLAENSINSPTAPANQPFQIIDPNATQILNWIARDLCAFCGSPHGDGKERYSCYCRYCESCAGSWKSDVRAELDEGRPRHQVCPACLLANAHGAFEYRQSQVTNIATIVAAEATLPAEAVQWRDAFCHECEGSECLSGTALQLAEKIFTLGWAIENLKLGNLICPTCQDTDPTVDDFWAEAENRYDRWKDSRFED